MKYALAVIFIAQLFSACSPKYGISKARAYVREKVAGTIPVDDSGRPLSSGVSEEHLLFVETDSAQPSPTFTAAWVNQKPYSIRPIEMAKSNEPVGKTVKGEQVYLSAKDGHKLWQLLLFPPQQNQASPPSSLAEKIQRKKIVITGTWKGKDFVYSFDKVERLEPLQFQ